MRGEFGEGSVSGRVKLVTGRAVFWGRRAAGEGLRRRHLALTPNGFAELSGD